ncbi:hypothetical protein [Nocardia barduliensis]|uniref:hypothetical protein n=1 Tax=Nocardia barduliensis TaxID=2736643 RepID=UPI001572CC06|nr:hypothetical protein [Nocardia barduliensis]
MTSDARQDKTPTTGRARAKRCPDGGAQLHTRSNAVYLLPHEGEQGAIVRLAPDTDLRRQRATTAAAVTRWLSDQTTEPLCLRPLPGEQPVIAAGAVATFWPYCPTTAAANLADVASLLQHTRLASLYWRNRGPERL